MGSVFQYLPADEGNFTDTVQIKIQGEDLSLWDVFGSLAMGEGGFEML